MIISSKDGRSNCHCKQRLVPYCEWKKSRLDISTLLLNEIMNSLFLLAKSTFHQGSFRFLSTLLPLTWFGFRPLVCTSMVNDGVTVYQWYEFVVENNCEKKKKAQQRRMARYPASGYISYFPDPGIRDQSSFFFFHLSERESFEKNDNHIVWIFKNQDLQKIGNDRSL